MKTNLTPDNRHTDRLRAAWRTPEGRILYQGKRVSKTCPLTHEERKAYVAQGPVAAIKLIQARLKTSLSDSYMLLNQARYGQDYKPL